MWIFRGLRKGVLTTPFPDGKHDLLPAFRPESTDTCPMGKDSFSCLECALCGMKESYEEIRVRRELEFGSSVHIFMLDAGSCAACNREVSLLTAPQYDLHRLGFFFTPTPKHADVLLVMGDVTAEMEPVLKEAYELMPEPKAVLAVGACANGAFGKKIEEYVPVDAWLSGCPPQPIEILKALLMLTGRWKP